MTSKLTSIRETLLVAVTDVTYGDKKEKVELRAILFPLSLVLILELARYKWPWV